MQYNGIKIRKRKDGRWEAKKQINGNRINITKNTQLEVFEELKLLFPKEIKTQKVNTTLFEYIDYWYKTYKEPFLTKQRKNVYNCVINNQIKPYFQNKEIIKYTAFDANLAITKIPNTRQKEDATQYIRTIFKSAYKDKKIRFDIYEDIIKYHHKREEGKALTIEQRKKFIQVCKQIEKGDIFLFYLYTGARASEILNINPKTDIANGFIRLPGTKTEKSDRWIPIFEPVKEILNKKDLTADKLFDISYTTLKREIPIIRKKCGFDLRIKDLRTTFGTICAEQGIAEKVIAKWMGHTNTRTTQKYYIKVLNSFEKQEYERLNSSFCATFADTYTLKSQKRYKRNQYIVKIKFINHKI